MRHGFKTIRQSEKDAQQAADNLRCGILESLHEAESSYEHAHAREQIAKLELDIAKLELEIADKRGQEFKILSLTRGGLFEEFPEISSEFDRCIYEEITSYDVQNAEVREMMNEAL